MGSTTHSHVMTVMWGTYILGSSWFCMNTLLILVVGFGAAIGTTAAWFPQVARTWNTRSARDFSWGYLSLFIMGVFLWTMYGVLRHDLVVIIANGITLLLVISVGMVKAREGTKKAGR